MASVKFFPRLAALAAAVLGLSLGACITSPARYSFVVPGTDPRFPEETTVTRGRPLSDYGALRYADGVAAMLRSHFTGARLTREASATAQIGLAGFTGAGAAFGYGTRTLAALGLAGVGVPELQRIFDAKGRAQVYQDAVRLIEEAMIEYLALNQNPSSKTLTQNGVTLFQRVTASVHVVEKTLAGSLPSVRDMQKATEPMTREGAVATRAGDPVFNNTPANPDAVAALDMESERAKRRETWRRDPAPIRDKIPGPAVPPEITGIPTEGQMRIELTQRAAKLGSGDDKVFQDIYAAMNFTPTEQATIKGGSVATRLLSAYKQLPEARRRELAGLIIVKPNP